jgi:hypothetical protein
VRRCPTHVGIHSFCEIRSGRRKSFVTA